MHLPFQASEYFIDKVKQFYNENKLGLQADLVFVGDSLTEMYDVKKYYPDIKVMNRGISGDLSVGVNITMESRVMFLKPKLIVLMIGSNDLSYWGYNYDITIDHINDSLNTIKQIDKNCAVIINTIPPCYYYKSNKFVDQNNHRPSYKIKEFNQRLKEFSSKRTDFTLFDLYPFLADENGSLPLEYTNDGLHLSTLAYDKMTEALKDTINSLLKK